MRKTVALIALLSTFSLNASVWDWFYSSATPIIDEAKEKPDIAAYPQTMLSTLFTLQQTIPTGSGPAFIAYSPSGKIAAVPNAHDNSLTVYHVDSSSNTFTELTGSPYTTGVIPNFVAFSPSDQHAAVTSSTINPPDGNRSDSSIFVYSIDCESGEFSLIQTITRNEDPNLSLPTSIAYSPDGRFAAVANFGDTTAQDGISIYRVSQTSGKLLLPSIFLDTRSARQPFILAYHPNGRSVSVTFFQASRVGTYQIDPVDGTFSNLKLENTGSSPQGLAYSHDGNFLATVSTAGELRRFSVNSATGKLAVPPQAVPAGVNAAYDAYSRDGTILAVTNRDDNSIFAYCNAEIAAPLPSPNPSIISVPEPWGIAFAPCSDYVAVTSFSTNTVQIFKVDTTVCP